MESTAPKTLTFKVARKTPELIPPAKPTPHEFKLLSDIDDQQGLRFLAVVIQFYRRNPSMEGKDPARVIRDALARALVFYYPLAGRLRERAAKKLVVECTGEGSMFVEAKADVALHQFGDPIHPPFPCVDKLFYDVPASAGFLNSPLIYVQLTRLSCGGFIFAIRINHAMNDAVGVANFLSAISELARGAESPSIAPVWERHLLSARKPPRVTCTHPEYDDLPANAAGEALTPLSDMMYRSFFFGPREFAGLRSNLPPHLRNSSRFELLTACLWRCRTVAISPEPHEEMKIMMVVNSRGRFNPPLPTGYYGNVISSPAALATAGDLSRNPLSYALELVRKTKSEVTEEFVRSMADLLVIKGRPFYNFVRGYAVSDLTHSGFEEFDFGWGKPVYGGQAEGCAEVPGVVSFFIPLKNRKGDSGIIFPIRLPPKAMKVFAEELQRMVNGGPGDQVITTASKL